MIVSSVLEISDGILDLIVDLNGDNFIQSNLLKKRNEYPFAMVSVIFQVFASFCIGNISHQQQKGYNSHLSHWQLFAQ